MNRFEVNMAPPLIFPIHSWWMGTGCQPRRRAVFEVPCLTSVFLNSDPERIAARDNLHKQWIRATPGFRSFRTPQTMATLTCREPSAHRRCPHALHQKPQAKRDFVEEHRNHVRHDWPGEGAMTALGVVTRHGRQSAKGSNQPNSGRSQDRIGFRKADACSAPSCR